MRLRKAAAWLLMASLALSACSRSSAPSAPVEPAPPAPVEPVPQGPDLSALKDPHELPFDELLQELERYLSQGEGSLAEKLGRLYAQWDLKATDRQRTPFVEADLNGDGKAELVTALRGKGGITGQGSLLVITEQDGRVVIDRPGGEPVMGAALFRVLDLTGDGAPEIIWISTTVGAHTAHSSVLVSRWQPGRIENLPGSMVTSYLRLEVEERDLLLIGGIIGSVGAGGVQRVRTDRYRWTEDEFRLVDRRFEDSPLAYHRLMDGIVAESHGRKAEAETAYREATEEGREVLMPGGVEAEQEEALAQAVRAFARFRLGAFLLQEGRPAEAKQVLAGAAGPFAGLPGALADAADRTAGCQAAERWAEATPSFLEAMASPFGYAKPEWQPADLCGDLPPINP